MGAFEYKAVEPGGRERRGLLEGDTAKQVRQSLREMGLLPLAVTEVAQREKKARSSLTLRRGLNSTELALITRQLATMVRSGLPLDECLQAVAEQNEKPRLKRVLLGVRSRVMEGHTLASGFGDFPGSFPEIFRATVDAGEQSGHLENVLERLADYTEGRQLVRQKILQAMIYPIMLTVVAIAIIVFLLVGVVPKVVEVFDDMNKELPALTTALISSSEFIKAYGVYLLVLIIGLAIGVRYMLQQPGVRRRYHLTLLKLPLVGRFVRSHNTAQFASTLSIMASSGVPVLTALKIAGSVVTNLPMRDAIETAAERVREGAAIGKSLAVSRLFPPMTMHLISSGEASGELEEMLDRAARNQERELDTLRQSLTSLLGPILILLMGGVVLLIVLAILLPIFNLNELTV